MIIYRSDLYLLGGINILKNLLYYDVERNEWNLVEVQMKRGRFCYIMVVVREFIYIIGGKNLKVKEGKNVLSFIEEYSIRGRRWRVMGELMILVYFVVFIVIGERIYIFGGID